MELYSLLYSKGLLYSKLAEIKHLTEILSILILVAIWNCSIQSQKIENGHMKTHI
jgi:hypothetical protein